MKERNLSSKYGIMIRASDTNYKYSYFQKIVAIFIAEIPCSNLRAHVPTVKGSSSELQPSNIKQQTRHGWNGIPLELHVLKPLEPNKKINKFIAILPLSAAIVSIVLFHMFIIIIKTGTLLSIFPC